MQTISNFIFEIISDLNNHGKLPFRKTKNESEETPRFSEDKPAQKAGLQKGDIVLRLGDSMVVDMISYMKVLATFEKGNTIKVVVERAGKKIEAKIEF